MSNTTKAALGASLKELLLHKPIDKITINNLTEDCGISRMAFYYHFKDIYDLLEWVFVEDGRKALQSKNTYETWQEGLLQVFEAVLKSKPLILNAYRPIGKEKVENYLHKITYDLIVNVVEEKCAKADVTEEDKVFIAEFYKYAFVGIMLDWIDGGMKDDYREIVRRISIALHGNIVNSIYNFEQVRKK